MHVPDIINLKKQLDGLKEKGVIAQWELPYENLLTRLSAAIFFIQPANQSKATLESVMKELGGISNFSWRTNTEKKLSQLDLRLTFSVEELEKNGDPSLLINQEAILK